MYIIKIKGKAKIPDYLQVRDDNFTLICYTRTDRPEKALEKCGLAAHVEYIKSVMNEIPFGKMTKINLQ
ncbi:MAG: fructose-6-phosphate aldolase [Bacteroidetes bacterium]|nr:fructose-6-phosphate aldolase [Bacteroidota bacterium]MCK6609877.1 fructose-6-phosphate aldolase [Bacteroidia bacterium]